MAPLPKPFSLRAHEIGSAVNEGRALDAMDALIATLRTGQADRATQLLAAEWIATLGVREGDAKALRRGNAALPKEWAAIADMVQALQETGETYADAVERAAAYFGYSQRHVETCVAFARS